MKRFSSIVLIMSALLAGCSGEAPIPAETACHAGGYRLDDGSIVGLIPREPGDLRYQFFSGETGTVLEDEDGLWQGSDPAEAVSISLGTCDDPAIEFTEDGVARAGTRIPYAVTETVFDGVDGKRAGRLVLPVDRPTEAILVSVHGSERWSGRVGGRLQSIMPAVGIGVFAYDKRGTGASQGKYTQDFDILAGDAVRARREARRLYGEAIPIGYLGGSQGGWVAPYAASMEGADFIIAAYGMAVGPLAEDREEVFLDLREAGYGEDVIEQAREITDATGRVIASRFKEGYAELTAVRRKYRDEQWYEDIEGEFTGQFLSAPNIGLRLVGPWLDVGTSWNYAPRPVIESLTMPQLWILAGKDRVAPSANTLAILRELQRSNRELDVVVFANTDHGIVEFVEDADGRRTSTGVAEGYYALIRDFILTGEPDVTVEGVTVYRSALAAE